MGTPRGGPSITTIAPAPGMGHVPSPYGELHLIPAAADAWNAMRAEALSAYGIDIYPGGPALGLPHLRAAGGALQRVSWRASAHRPTRPAPPHTNSGPRSTSRAPRCARSSTRSAGSTAGERSTVPASGGTWTISAAEKTHRRSGHRRIGWTPVITICARAAAPSRGRVADGGGGSDVERFGALLPADDGGRIVLQAGERRATPTGRTPCGRG